MRVRKLGITDLHLTTIGLGTADIGGGWAYGGTARDDAESIATVHRALDLGINWIDTAPTYGRAEEVAGRALAGRREGVIIATKCSTRYFQCARYPPCSKTQSVRCQVEASLRRLNVEVIDLCQIHWPDSDEGNEEAWGAMADLIREGKVRYAGVSNFNVEQLKRVQAIHPVASLQPPYSMLDRGIEKDLLAYCVANDIGVIAYSPMQSGLLTGRFTREYVTGLPVHDWRKAGEHFQEPRLSVNLEFVERLRPIAERNGRTVGQLAIAWVLQRPEVTAAIVGARKPSQIEETAPAGDWILSAEESAEIGALIEALEKAYAEGGAKA